MESNSLLFLYDLRFALSSAKSTAEPALVEALEVKARSLDKNFLEFRMCWRKQSEKILEVIRLAPFPVIAMIPLLLATHNGHKTEEVRAILGREFHVFDLTELPGAPEPEESGRTFSENAAIKALAASALVSEGTWVLADDSGLEVDALGGAPGVLSARYSGRHGDNPGHRAKLLAALREADTARCGRKARFRCSLALVRAGQLVARFDGTIEGTIAVNERGSGGFGYDSLFIPEGETLTFGELPETAKNRLSHRARALQALVASGVCHEG